MGYKKICLLEKQHTTESVGIIQRKLSLVEQLNQVKILSYELAYCLLSLHLFSNINKIILFQRLCDPVAE